MKNILFAAVLCAVISPAFAATNFAYKVGDLPPRLAKEQAMRMESRVGHLSRNEKCALLAVGVTLLAYGMRNKKRALMNQE